MTHRRRSPSRPGDASRDIDCGPREACPDGIRKVGIGGTPIADAMVPMLANLWVNPEHAARQRARRERLRAET